MPAREVYPAFLVLEGRPVLVAGGGVVALRKIEELLRARAKVRVVAALPSPEVRALAAARTVELAERAFAASDLEGIWLVVACTDDATVQSEIASRCEARALFCLAVDDIDNASVYGGSVVRRPPFLIALSSGGELPALTRAVREIVEAVLPAEDFVNAARELRAAWRREGRPMGSRFPELVQRLADKARGRE